MNLYFTFDCHNSVNLFSTPIGIKTRNKKLAIAVRVFQSTKNLDISRCCFAEDGNEMFKDFKPACIATVILIFIWRRSITRDKRGEVVT